MTIAALALLSAIAAGPVVQADAPRAEGRSEVRVFTMGSPGRPGGLDADGDGAVTREEFSAPMISAFDRIDTDHDGRLSTEELARGHEGEPGDHILMMHGGPGGPGGPGMMTFRPDGHGGDAQVFMFRRGGPEGGPSPADGPGEHRVEVRRFGGPGGSDMDADSDGKVSEEEFLAPMREAFRSMDADNDGSLDQAERPHGPPAPPRAPGAPRPPRAPSGH